MPNFVMNETKFLLFFCGWSFYLIKIIYSELVKYHKNNLIFNKHGNDVTQSAFTAKGINFVELIVE